MIAGQLSERLKSLHGMAFSIARVTHRIAAGDSSDSLSAPNEAKYRYITLYLNAVDAPPVTAGAHAGAGARSSRLGQQGVAREQRPTATATQYTFEYIRFEMHGSTCVATADERAAGVLAPEKIEQIVAEFDRSVHVDHCCFPSTSEMHVSHVFRSCLSCPISHC